jgi:monoamine oxidase
MIFSGGTDGILFNPRTAFDFISNSTGNISASLYINSFLNDLDEIWPNSSKYYTGDATVSAAWVSKYSYGSYPAYTLGQYSTIHGYEYVRQGNIHFAGDYTSKEYFGLMEGAASEGERAGKEIINDYK